MLLCGPCQCCCDFVSKCFPMLEAVRRRFDDYGISHLVSPSRRIRCKLLSFLLTVVTNT